MTDCLFIAAGIHVVRYPGHFFPLRRRSADVTLWFPTGDAMVSTGSRGHADAFRAWYKHVNPVPIGIIANNDYALAA